MVVISFRLDFDEGFDKTGLMSSSSLAGAWASSVPLAWLRKKHHSFSSIRRFRRGARCGFAATADARAENLIKEINGEAILLLGKGVKQFSWVKLDDMSSMNFSADGFTFDLKQWEVEGSRAILKLDIATPDIPGEFKGWRSNMMKFRLECTDGHQLEPSESGVRGTQHEYIFTLAGRTARALRIEYAVNVEIQRFPFSVKNIEVE